MDARPLRVEAEAAALDDGLGTVVPAHGLSLRSGTFMQRCGAVAATHAASRRRVLPACRCMPADYVRLVCAAQLPPGSRASEATAPATARRAKKNALARPTRPATPQAGRCSPVVRPRALPPPDTRRASDALRSRMRCPIGLTLPQSGAGEEGTHSSGRSGGGASAFDAAAPRRVFEGALGWEFSVLVLSKDDCEHLLEQLFDSLGLLRACGVHTHAFRAFVHACRRAHRDNALNNWWHSANAVQATAVMLHPSGGNILDKMPDEDAFALMLAGAYAFQHKQPRCLKPARTLRRD